MSLYNQINSSAMKLLSRSYKHCSNGSSSNEETLSCVFNFALKPCNSRNATFYTADSTDVDNADGVCNWQGMCHYLNKQVVICGTAGPTATTGLGLVYIGNVKGDISTQTSYTFQVPGATSTSCYGPRYDFNTRLFTLVGSYMVDDSITYGFLFRGELNELTDASKYTTTMQLVQNEYTHTFTHSTDGNFAVGASGNAAKIKTMLHAWIFNISTRRYTPYTFPNFLYTTIYGIILNKDGTYTMLGGCSNGIGTHLTSAAFIVDMSYSNGEFTFFNETSINLPGNMLNHFEGISRTNDPTIYTVAGDGAGIGDAHIGFACVIQRDATNKKFNLIYYTNVDAACSMQQSGKTSCNSILDNTVVGVFTGEDVIPYQCVIDFSKIP